MCNDSTTFHLWLTHTFICIYNYMWFFNVWCMYQSSYIIIYQSYINPYHDHILTHHLTSHELMVIRRHVWIDAWSIGQQAVINNLWPLLAFHYFSFIIIIKYYHILLLMSAEWIHDPPYVHPGIQFFPHEEILWERKRLENNCWETIEATFKIMFHFVECKWLLCVVLGPTLGTNSWDQLQQNTGTTFQY